MNTHARNTDIGVSPGFASSVMGKCAGRLRLAVNDRQKLVAENTASPGSFRCFYGG